MKLNKADREYLTRIGHTEKDLEQIERATRKTIYEFVDNADGSCESYHKEKVSAEKAIELLGRETYLSGLSRSAFHFTAAREIDGTNNIVYFDSSKLFS
jgi:hypothetical protein